MKKIIIPLENNENHEIHRFPVRIMKIKKQLIIQNQNHENQ